MSTQRQKKDRSNLWGWIRLGCYAGFKIVFEIVTNS